MALWQFIIVSVITCIDAIEHLATGKRPENSTLIIAFSVVTMLLLGAIGCIKWWLNSHIHSKALEQVCYGNGCFPPTIICMSVTFYLRRHRNSSGSGNLLTI